MIEAAIRKRSQTHSVKRTSLLEEISEGLHDFIVLGVDVDSQGWPGCEKVFEEGDRGHSVDPRRSNLRPWKLRNESGLVGDSIKVIVVEGDDDPIGGHVSVRLDVDVPQLDSVREGLKRVFWPIACSASMGKGDRAVIVKEWMRSDRHG